MDKEGLEWLAERVETLVEDLKATKATNEELLAEKKKLEQKLSSNTRQIEKVDKEGNQVAELTAQNKAYKKKCVLLRSKVTSMLAKVEVLQ
jgi:predicted nuclease with TOPRIM domain